MTETVKFLPQS